MAHYETALICLKGHVITSTIESSPESVTPFCTMCGSKTISSCPNCGARILGYHNIPGVIHAFYDIPAYCHQCGKPYPWTEEKLKAAKELIDLAEIPNEEKQSIKDDLPELMVDTPRTAVAVTKVSIFLKKASREIAHALRDILIDIASETAKKSLGL